MHAALVYFRRRLFRQTSNQQKSSKNIEALKAVKRNLQLCILQLSQALPMVVHRALIFVGNKWWMDEFVNDNENKPILSHAYQFAIVWGLIDVVDSVEHFFHFYLYMALSKVQTRIRDKVTKEKTRS